MTFYGVLNPIHIVWCVNGLVCVVCVGMYDYGCEGAETVSPVTVVSIIFERMHIWTLN